MSPQILTVLSILIVVIVLLITEWAPLGALAMLVMGSLAVTGLIDPKEALAGFSNPAVITIWAVFILSGGLTKTGIANILGRQILRVAGKGESTLIIVIMIIAGGMSAFMNNVAVAALMLPVIMDIARKTERSPTLLLLPLAYGSLLGGLTTMIGTPPNILVSEALAENGLEEFGLFDYTPVGLCVMGGGVLFMTFIGKHILPKSNTSEPVKQNALDYFHQYRLKDHLFQIRIPQDSPLNGKSLADSRLGAALGLSVIGITRGDRTLLAPTHTETLQSGDVLMVEGSLNQIQEFNHWGELVTETESVDSESLVNLGVQAARLRLHPESRYLRQTLSEIEFRNRYGLHVLAIERKESVLDTDLKNHRLNAEDLLLVVGPMDNLATIRESSQFHAPVILSSSDLNDFDSLAHGLHQLRVPDQSKLVGLTVEKSRLGDAVDIQILCIVRKDGTAVMPSSNDRFAAQDRLIVWGTDDMVSILRMQGLEGTLVEEPLDLTDPSMLEDESTGMVEVMLSPHSYLSGTTLRKLNFREKYGLTVLSIWRKGTAHQENLRDMVLELGDALLLHGAWEKIQLLGREPDFLVLTETAQEVPRKEKAKLAMGIMAAALFPAIMGWLPIYISAVIGAAFMIISRCLTMEEAFRYIEWKAVFLIAGMLPLGTALERTGAAKLLAEGVIQTLGPLGPYAILFGLLSITFLATSIIPTSALVVLMVPIALESAAGLGISPHALMMGIAMAASSSFTSPISHPANVLVMGPGGYKFIDFIKVGVPLTLVVGLILMIVLPIFWPL
jgi:di/tricarboxylate transporter